MEAGKRGEEDLGYVAVAAAAVSLGHVPLPIRLCLPSRPIHRFVRYPEPVSRPQWGSWSAGEKAIDQPYPGVACLHDAIRLSYPHTFSQSKLITSPPFTFRSISAGSIQSAFDNHIRR